MSEQISITIPNTPECIHALHSFASVLMVDLTPEIRMNDVNVIFPNDRCGNEPLNTPETNIVPESNIELDMDGIPWDARIHSSGKTKIKDGTWKKLRGLPPGYADAIIKEIKEGTAASANTLPIAPNTTIPQQQIIAPAPVQLQPQQVAPSSSQSMQFKDLMAAMANKGIKFNGVEMTTALLQHGVIDEQGNPCFSKLVSTPEKILDVAVTAGIV